MCPKLLNISQVCILLSLSPYRYHMQEAFADALGPTVNANPASPEETPAKGPATPQPNSEKTNPPAENKSNTPSLPFEAIHPPAMYTSTTQSTDASSLNARASWLAGRPVHGNALLTYTKIRHTAWLVPAVVFSSDFTLDVYWEWVHGLLPELEYVNKGTNALVSRLPTVYRCV